MFQVDRSFFIDSTDSSATELNERFQLQLSNPISSENSFNDIYVALQSFSITNTLYNVLEKDVLTFFVIYNDASYSSKTPFVSQFQVSLPSGFYSASQIVSAWNTSITTTNTSLNKVILNHKNYTVSAVVNPNIAPKLGYNSLTGKFYFDWSTTTEYTIPNSQLTSSDYPNNPAPSGLFFQLNNTSYYMMYRLGMYMESDTLTNYSFSGGQFGSGVLIPITFTKTVGSSSTTFKLSFTTYNMLHVFVEAAVNYVDLLCEQVVPDQYTSTVKVTSPTQTIMRIPILSTFQQNQQIYYSNLVWCKLNENSLNTVQFTLRNPFTQEQILKCPMLIQLSIHEEVADLEDLGQPAEQQRFVAPITFTGKRSIDQLANPQQPLSASQLAYRNMNYRR